jgi:hypothetical protein
VLLHYWLLLYVQFFFGGGRHLRKAQSLILCIPLEIPNARFTNSSPKAFLSSSSDVLSILRRSCHLVPELFTPSLPRSCCFRPRSLMPLLHFVSSRTSVFSEFSVLHYPGRISCDRVPSTVPLLHDTSSLCVRRPVPSAIHDLPGSEFS